MKKQAARYLADERKRRRRERGHHLCWAVAAMLGEIRERVRRGGPGAHAWAAAIDLPDRSVLTFAPVVIDAEVTAEYVRHVRARRREKQG